VKPHKVSDWVSTTARQWYDPNFNPKLAVYTAGRVYSQFLLINHYITVQLTW